MSTKIIADNGAEIKVGQLGITVDHPEGIASIWARLSPWQRRSLADALDQDAAVVIGGRLTAPESQYKRERDAAVARAEQAERELAALRGRVEDIIPGTEVIHDAWNGEGIGRVKFERELGVQCLIRDRVLAAIEAEAVVDPVEAKARVEADRRYSGDPNHAFIEGAVWAARHLNEQDSDQ